jgi:UDP-N-acetylmuramate: L-alanyl-gamma-D-glutamyl-meso-diaminopimelate ligase
MGAFAAYLKKSGFEVTGSDQNVYPPMSDVLARAGVVVSTPYAAENVTGLNPRPDLVIIGNVISANHPEARAAIDGGYRYSSLPEAMEKFLLPETRNCVVAGTHGKTTTSSLLAYVFDQAGLQPNYFIGGVSQNLPTSFEVPRLEKSAPFILEGDEYDTAFWDKVPKFNHYLPDDVILTSVEYDHADIYPDFAAVERAFEGLMDRLRPGARLIACTDYASIRRLLGRVKNRPDVQVITYGSPSNTDADFRVSVSGQQEAWTRIRLESRAGQVTEWLQEIPGQHNALNAAAVWILGGLWGLSEDQRKLALKSFRGVKRRQEERGEVRGVLVLDDFAHHPTAVRETLSALKLKYPKRKLTVVFEPRSATSRRKVFQSEYAKAFSLAEQIWIAAPYDQSKIASHEQFSSDQLVADLRANGKSAECFQEIEDGVKQVARQSHDGDLIAVLSNGGFGGFIPKLLNALAG